MELSMSRSALGVAICATGALGAWLYLRGGATSPYQEQFTSPVARVSKLYVYPVKSCHRVQVDSVECWKRGLKYDRWLLLASQPAGA